MPITRNLLDIVKSKAEEVNARGINSIKVVIGELSGVEKDCVAFYFDILKSEYGMDGASLNFDIVPARITCRDCSKTFTPDVIPWICPGCSGLNLSIENGSECYIESIEVD